MAPGRIAAASASLAEARAWLAERITVDPGSAGQDDAGGGEEQGHSLKAIFRGRLIAVRTMGRNLRLALVGALLVLVVASVFVGLRDVAFASTHGGGTTSVEMPRAVLWLTIVLLVVAWTYVLWGVLHAHPLVRGGGLALFGWAMFELWNDAHPLAAWRMAPSYALLACVWLLGAATARLRPLERWRQELQLFALPLLLLSVGGLYAASWWRVRPLHDGTAYTLLVYHQLVQLSFALIPLLYVAGVDFAEWGDVVSTRAAEIAGGARWVYALAAGASAVAGLALADRLWALGGRTFAIQLGFGVLFVALVGVPALVAARSRAGRRVPYVALLAAALLTLVLVLGGAHLFRSRAALASGGLAILRHPAPPRFQLAYPAGWGERVLPGQDGLAGFVLGPPRSDTRFFVLYVPAALAPGSVDPADMLFHPSSRTRSREGPWSVERFTAQGTAGVAWEQRLHGAIWMLAGVTGKDELATAIPVFRAISDSWMPSVAAAAPAAKPEAARDVKTDDVLATEGVVWLGAAALGAVLLVRRRRRNPAWLSAGALFFVATGVFYFLVDLPHLAHRLGWPNEAAHLRLPGLQIAVAAGTLVFVGASVARRRFAPPVPQLIGLLLVLNGGLLAIQWLDRLIEGEKAAGRFSIAEGALLIVAFGWDILMSGEAITNRHTDHVPRHARVLVYLGYVLLVTTAVLFFSTIRFFENGRLTEPGFVSDSYPETGLLVLGSALLVTLFVARIGGLWHRPAPAVERDPAEGAVA